MTQKEIVKMAQAGNADAFCMLYDMMKDRLYRYAYYRLSNSDDAEDAVSDAVLSAYIQIKELKNPDAFSAWMFKILSASCNKYIRRQIEQRETANGCQILIGHVNAACSGFVSLNSVHSYLIFSQISNYCFHQFVTLAV